MDGMASAKVVRSGVFVTVDIAPDRVDDFLKAMHDDVTKSRVTDYDPDCYRFDLLRDRDDQNKFVFYEAYKNDDAAAFHKTTSHYNSWAEFKKSGGVAAQAVAKVETGSLGDWAFQSVESGDTTPVRSAVIVTVEIKEDRISDFLIAMEDDATKSRMKALDPGCMRFDLLRDRDNSNKFYFYEVYKDDEAAAFHKTTSHYNSWADFKKSGGVVSQTVQKVETASIGAWAFQCFPPSCPLVTLGSGFMPLVGFGTYKVGAVPASASSAADGAPPPPSGPDVCIKIVTDALNSGYSMLDCAQFYMNEAWVGSAWRASGVARENIYITSKVWNDIIYKGADAVKAQVHKAIADLQCSYIDLFLVHWPVPGKHVEAYNALRDLKKEGKLRAIGVSNYCIEDMEELKAAGCYGDAGADKPVMNQIEVNPMLFRKKTLDYFKKEGIHIQSYRGLMQAGKTWENPVLQEVCKETGKSPAQVLGRFLVQQGISHVPKASTAERMKENRDIFNFDLTADHIEKLSNLTDPAALDNFKNLYIKCIWRDTPQAGDPWPSERTLD